MDEAPSTKRTQTLYIKALVQGKGADVSFTTLVHIGSSGNELGEKVRHGHAIGVFIVQRHSEGGGFGSEGWASELRRRSLLCLQIGGVRRLLTCAD